MTLNRNPENYFAEVEQLAFAPSHMVPGIEPSPDKMLQGRLFSYSDTHRHRLGVNYQSIPVNCPFATKIKNYQRDGPARVDGNQGGAPNYFPNSFGGPVPAPETKWHVERATGDVERVETGDEDNFTQCGQFFRNVLSPAERERLTDNIAGNLAGAQEFIQQRALSNFAAADANYGKMIQEKLARLNAANKKKASSQAKASAPLNPPRSVPRGKL
jgi:catalase